MLLFIGKRLIYFILGLLVLILVSLVLFEFAPSDPIEQLMESESVEISSDLYEKTYVETAKRYQLDYPLFFFSIVPSNYPKSLQKIIYPSKNLFFKRMLGSGVTYESIESLDDLMYGLKTDTSLTIGSKNSIGSLITSESLEVYMASINEISNELEIPIQKEIKEKLSQLNSEMSILPMLIPKIQWHGSKNQFFKKLKQTISLDFRHSFRDGKKVSSKIKSAFLLTSFLIFMTLIIAFPLGIWLGKSIYFKNNWLTQFVEIILFMFTSIPLFWLATMFVILFTTPEYGKLFHIFTNVQSYGFSSENSLMTNIIQNGKQMILPVICLILADLAIIMRQTSSLLSIEAGKPYVTTAAMKGLSKSKIINQHQFINTKSSLLVMLSNGLSQAFAGSVLIEYIFNIPGMGRLMLDSVIRADWPVLFGIIILLFVIAFLIYLLTDIINMKLDPRIKISS